MNKNLQFLLVSNSIFVFAGNLFAPLYALFVLQEGGGVFLAGLLTGAQFLTSTLVGYLVIQLKDRASLDRSLLKLNYLVRGGAWMALAIVPSIPTLLLAQIMIGASEAVGTPAFNSLVSENLDYRQHIREWGMLELIKNLVLVAASILGGLVAAMFGFRSLFVAMAGLAFISLSVYQTFGKYSK